jgi:hypothetical protein
MRQILTVVGEGGKSSRWEKEGNQVGGKRENDTAIYQTPPITNASVSPLPVHTYPPHIPSSPPDIPYGAHFCCTLGCLLAGLGHIDEAEGGEKELFDVREAGGREGKGSKQTAL